MPISQIDAELTKTRFSPQMMALFAASDRVGLFSDTQQDIHDGFGKIVLV